MKPKKMYYKDQKEIFKEFLKFIEPFFQKYKEIKEVYLWGSLVDGTFGLYEKEYREQTGSDVDLVIFLEKNSDIPKGWKNLNAPQSWFDLYKDREFRKFEYKGNIHKVDLLVAHKGKTVESLKKSNQKVKKKFILIYKK